MVIKLQSKKKKPVPAPPQHKFTLQDIEDLFSQSKNWNDFFEKNKTKFWKENLDIYAWCVYPLHYKEGSTFRCILHPMVEVDAGDKKYNFLYQNVHYSEFISHCIFYHPEEHKKFIIEKLLKGDVKSTTQSSTPITRTDVP